MATKIFFLKDKAGWRITANGKDLTERIFKNIQVYIFQSEKLQRIIKSPDLKAYDILERLAQRNGQEIDQQANSECIELNPFEHVIIHGQNQASAGLYRIVYNHPSQKLKTINVLSGLKHSENKNREISGADHKKKKHFDYDAVEYIGGDLFKVHLQVTYYTEKAKMDYDGEWKSGMVRSSAGWKIYDIWGTNINDQNYQDIGHFNGEWLPVQRKDGWSIIDRSGKHLLPERYLHLQQIKGDNRRFLAAQNRLRLIITQHGFNYTIKTIDATHNGALISETDYLDDQTPPQKPTIEAALTTTQELLKETEFSYSIDEVIEMDLYTLKGLDKTIKIRSVKQYDTNLMVVEKAFLWYGWREQNEMCRLAIYKSDTRVENKELWFEELYLKQFVDNNFFPMNDNWYHEVEPLIQEGFFLVAQPFIKFEDEAGNEVYEACRPTDMQFPSFPEIWHVSSGYHDEYGGRLRTPHCRYGIVDRQCREVIPCDFESSYDAKDALDNLIATSK